MEKQRKEEPEKRKSQQRRSQTREKRSARTGKKSRKNPTVWGSGGSKISTLAKAAGAEPHEAHFEIRMCKANHVRSTFGS